MTTPSSHHDRHLWQFRWVRDLFVLGFAAFLLWLGHRIAVVTVPLLVALMAAYLCEPLVKGLARRAPWLGRTGSAFTLLAALVLMVAGLAALVVVPVSIQAVDMARDAPRLLARIEAYLTSEERPEWISSRVEPLLEPVVSATHAASAEVAPDTPPTSAQDAEGDTDAHADAVAERDADALAERDADTVTVPGGEDGVDRSGTSEDVTSATESDEPSVAPLAAPQDAFEPLKVALTRIVSVVGGTAEAILAIGLFLGIFLFAFVPLSASFPAVARWLRNLLPPAMRSEAAPLLDRMDEMVSGFVRGRLLTAAILAAIYATGWSLVGVPYAAVVGILTGVASLVPYGAALGLPVTWVLVTAAALGADEPSLYAAESGGGFEPIWWRILLIPAAVNAVAQLLEDYVLNPLIQGKATQLHPLVIMLAIIAGGSLLGLYGMLLAVPVVACANVLIDAVVAPALRRWAEHASTSDVDSESGG